MTKLQIASILIILSFNISYTQNTFSQSESHLALNSSNTGFVHNLNSDLGSMYKVGRGFFESPLHFDSEDLILMGIIAGTTAISTSLDNPVRNSVRKSHSLFLDRITPFGDDFGNGKYGAALSGILYIGGHVLQDKELRKTGLMLAETILLNGIVTEGFKIVMGRSRPYTNEGNLDIDFLGMKLENEDHSLPSGHASTAFAIATVLSERIKNVYVSIALYSLAGLTSFQRIYTDNHWFSDTILGAALGTVIGLRVIKLNSEDDNEDQISGTSMKIIPLISRNGYGIGVAFSF